MHIYIYMIAMECYMHSNTMEMFSIMQEMLWETLIHLDIKDIIMM